MQINQQKRLGITSSQDINSLLLNKKRMKWFPPQFNCDANTSHRAAVTPSGTATRGCFSLYLEVLTALHEVLHIIDRRKEEVEYLKELVLLLRQPGVSEKLHQVAKVIAAANEREQGSSDFLIDSMLACWKYSICYSMQLDRSAAHIPLSLTCERRATWHFHTALNQMSWGARQSREY